MSDKKRNEHLAIIAFLSLYFIALVVLAFSKNGTGDQGDSVHHYLCAHYAFDHPRLFFDHWAKPVFTLLSAPFAYFGFAWMKVYNSLVTCLALYITCRSAVVLKYPQPWLAAFFGAFMPRYLLLTQSGLTEPTFALFLILGVYFQLKDKSLTAAILISFLPFVRYEGLVIMGVFGIYYLINREWKYLPLLLTGHVAYSLAGYYFHHDLFWVITENTNATFWSYGSGSWLHFVKNLFYVIGPPLYFLWLAGIIFMLIVLGKPSLGLPGKLFRKELWLVYGSMTAFIGAHTVFHGLGIFKSMGLLRVLICVLPLVALVCLNGWNAAFRLVPKGKWKEMLKICLLIYVAIFLFSRHPAAVQWERDLSLHPTQVLLEDVAKYLEDFPGRRFYYTAPYLSMLLNYDHFDWDSNRRFVEFLKDDVPSGSIGIWDNLFNVLDDGIQLEQLEKDSRLRKLKTFEVKNQWYDYQFVVFEFVGK